MEPSGRWWNHSGCLCTHGWSGEHCRAKSRATSMPRSRARATKRVKSSSVPSRGWTASWPPSGSRSPTARRRRRGRRPGCCSGPCGRWCRWGGSGAGRRRRSPSRRSRAAGGRPCRTCRAAAPACPRSGGRTRTRSRTGRVPARRAGERFAAGDQLPQGMPGQHRVHLRRQRRRQPGGTRQGVVAQGLGRREDHVLSGVARHPGRGARANRSPPSSRTSPVSMPAGTFTVATFRQVVTGSPQASTR